MDRRGYLKSSALALGIGVAGCTGGGDGSDGGGTTQPPSTDSGGGSTSTPTEQASYTTQLAAAHFPAVSVYAPMIYAQETGMFEEAGVTIEDITSFGGGGTTVRGIVTGGIGAGYPSLVAVVNAFLAGAPIHLVGLNTPTNDIEFVVREDSELEEFTASQLQGATFAASNPGSSSEALFIRSIQNTDGITLDDVEINYAGGYGEVLTSLREGIVDIGWSFPPFTFQLYEGGEMRQLAPARDHAPNITQNVIAMGAPFMNEQPELASKILGVYAEAQEYVEENPAEGGRLWAGANDLDPAVGERVIETVSEGTNFWDISPLEETVRATGETMVAQGVVDEEPPWSEVIRQDALPEDKRVDWMN